MCQASQESTEFTVFKDLTDQGDLAVWTAAMELRVSLVVPVFLEPLVHKVLMGREDRREKRACQVDSV